MGFLEFHLHLYYKRIYKNVEVEIVLGFGAANLFHF